MPKPTIPSLQPDMRGGDLPPPDEEGSRVLKVAIAGLRAQPLIAPFRALFAGLRQR